MSDLTREQANELSNTPKLIREKVLWTPTPTGFRLKARVLVPTISEVLELRAYIGRTKRNFCLLYKHLPIRRYDSEGRHTPPKGKGARVDGPHKHIWDKILRDAEVYIPNDIDVNGDPNDQFLQFLAEQNISLQSEYQRVMFGGG